MHIWEVLLFLSDNEYRIQRNAINEIIAEENSRWEM